MIPYVYDDVCYRYEEFLMMRKENAEYRSRYPEEYCKQQKDFQGKYIISVEGQKFIMHAWFKGLCAMRSKYGVKVFKYPSFSMLLSQHKSLPRSIDYVVRVDHQYSSNPAVSYDYVSKEACFTMIIGEERLYYKVYRGDKDKIESGYYDNYL